MKYTTSMLAAGLLACAVSPLFAQQGETPAQTPASEPAGPEEVAQVQAQAEEEAADALEAEESAEQVDDEVVQEAIPAQPAVRIRRAVAVQGNAAQLLIQPGVEFNGIARQFNDELAGLPELAMCAVTDDVTRDGDPSSFRVEVESPGLLTVAVRAKNRDDMTIEVYTETGHQLARCDIDFGGNTGAEHLAVPLPEAGSYRVVVEPLGAGGAFWIGSSFLAFDGLEAMAPLTPDDAIEITPDEAQDAAIAAAGPVEQWFTFTAPTEGILLFNTSADGGDLVIEAYHDGDFQNYFDYSDQDRNGSVGNERIMLEMFEGQTVFMKVRGLSGGQDIDFSTRSQFIDTSE
ncbi:MAG: PPC domain-containing protein [Phycisphaerales bacterium JB063]